MIFIWVMYCITSSHQDVFTHMISTWTINCPLYIEAHLKDLVLLFHNIYHDFTYHNSKQLSIWDNTVVFCVSFKYSDKLPLNCSLKFTLNFILKTEHMSFYNICNYFIYHNFSTSLRLRQWSILCVSLLHHDEVVACRHSCFLSHDKCLCVLTANNDFCLVYKQTCTTATQACRTAELLQGGPWDLPVIHVVKRSTVFDVWFT